MRRALQVLTGALCVVACVVHLVAQAVVSPVWIVGTIAFPVLGLLLWYVLSVRRWDSVALWAGAGLVFSWLGDGLGSVSLTIKIGFFLVAQICYVLAFWPVFRARHAGRSWQWHLRWLPYAVAVAVIIAVVAPQAGVLAPGVVVYGLALGVMAVLATGLRWRGFVGGVLFLVSDGILAAQEFTVWRFDHQGLLIMATYLVAQVLLASAVATRRA